MNIGVQFLNMQLRAAGRAAGQKNRLRRKKVLNNFVDQKIILIFVLRKGRKAGPA